MRAAPACAPRHAPTYWARAGIVLGRRYLERRALLHPGARGGGARLVNRRGMEVKVREARFREGLRHDDGRRTVAAPQVGLDSTTVA
jgi:hypothetical protein